MKGFKDNSGSLQLGSSSVTFRSRCWITLYSQIAEIWGIWQHCYKQMFDAARSMSGPKGFKQAIKARLSKPLHLDWFLVPCVLG